MIYIDGDIIVNKAAFAAQAQATETAAALSKLHDYVRSLIKRGVDWGHGKDVRIGLQGKDNFRYDVARIRPYKGQRKKQARPPLLPAMRAYLETSFHAEVINGMETDDWIGIECDDDSDLVISSDKDLDQVNSWHWNGKGGIDRYYVDLEESYETFYKQVLMGDVADNVCGIPGIGEKKAEKLLASVTSFHLTWDADYIIYKEYFKFIYNASIKAGDNLPFSELFEMTHDTVQEHYDLLWIRKRWLKRYELPKEELRKVEGSLTPLVKITI